MSPKLRLLIAEDHQLFRIGLRLLMSEWNEVELIGEAATGYEAIELATLHKPDLIIMDLGMPLLDGIEATKAIRKENPQVKVIVLTSHSDSRDISAALSAGATGYCLKDVDSERLRTAIQSVASGDVWLDARVAAHLMNTKVKPNLPKIELSSQEGYTQSFAPDDGPRLDADVVSPRELEVLALLVEGLSNKKIAERLFISPDTVKTHIRHIMEKLAAADRTDAAVKAVRNNLV
ncbi:MAG: response regulator transcription factor [Candidatus Melainabacteria bacterium]|nr:response regulator transcription factor [Candidatus Melainabacteria bacterium]